MRCGDSWGRADVWEECREGVGRVIGGGESVEDVEDRCFVFEHGVVEDTGDERVDTHTV